MRRRNIHSLSHSASEILFRDGRAIFGGRSYDGRGMAQVKGAEVSNACTRLQEAR